MSDMADFVNNEQAESLERLLDYQLGNMTEMEAIDCGLLGERGYLPADAPNLVGVEDCESLLTELDRCELTMLRLEARRSRPTLQRWRSGNKLYSPHEMTTAHLRNAIAYAERNGMDEPLIDAMKSELEGRQ